MRGNSFMLPRVFSSKHFYDCYFTTLTVVPSFFLTILNPLSPINVSFGRFLSIFYRIL